MHLQYLDQLKKKLQTWKNIGNIMLVKHLVLKLIMKMMYTQVVLMFKLMSKK